MHKHAEVGRKTYAPSGVKPLPHEGGGRDEIREPHTNQPLLRDTHRCLEAAVVDLNPHVPSQLEVKDSLTPDFVAAPPRDTGPRAAHLSRPLEPKPRLYIRCDRKEDWHRRNSRRARPTRLKPPGDRSRHGRKFDSTKGYPGEGPPKKGGPALFYKPCKLAPPATVCRIANHFHKKKAKAGAAKRLAEKKEERKEPRYIFCKTAGCTDPDHYHASFDRKKRGVDPRQQGNHVPEEDYVTYTMDDDISEPDSHAWFSEIVDAPPAADEDAKDGAPTSSNTDVYPSTEGEGEFSDLKACAKPGVIVLQLDSPEEPPTPAPSPTTASADDDGAPPRGRPPPPRLMVRRRSEPVPGGFGAAVHERLATTPFVTPQDRVLAEQRRLHAMSQLAAPAAPPGIALGPHAPGPPVLAPGAPHGPGHPVPPAPPPPRPVPTSVTVFANISDTRDMYNWLPMMDKLRRKGGNVLFWMRSLFHKSITQTAVYTHLEGQALRPTEQSVVRHIFGKSRQVKNQKQEPFFRIISKYYNSMFTTTVYVDIADACLKDTDLLFKRNILKADGTPYNTLEGTLRNHLVRSKLVDTTVHDMGVVANTIAYIGCTMIIRAAFLRTSFATAMCIKERPENESAAPSLSRSKSGGRTVDP